jgi:hypothetical protein
MERMFGSLLDISGKPISGKAYFTMWWYFSTQTGIELTYSVVIGTNSTGSCKSNFSSHGNLGPSSPVITLKHLTSLPSTLLEG